MRLLAGWRVVGPKSQLDWGWWVPGWGVLARLAGGGSLVVGPWGVLAGLAGGCSGWCCLVVVYGAWVVWAHHGWATMVGVGPWSGVDFLSFPFFSSHSRPASVGPP